MGTTCRLQVYDAVPHLLELGYTRIQGYDDSVSRRAQELFTILNNRWGEKLNRFAYALETRLDGTLEYDDGFLNWVSNQVPGKDTKWVFHFRPEMERRIRLDADSEPNPKFMADICRFLNAAHEVFYYHRAIAIAVANAVDVLTEGVLKLSDEIQEALDNPITTSRAALRFLDYPPQDKEGRAKIHFDRSGLTLHAGDEGGELFVHHEDGHDEVVSPKPGEILAFWGMKAELLGKERGMELRPLAHGSRARPREKRRATVSFWHVNRVLWDAPKVLY